MHIHILGICGTAMGGIALLARSAGHTVTGCDVGVYPPMSTQLQEQGIDLIAGWDSSQLHPSIDLYVIGNALSRGNPLVEAILNRGLPYTSGAQWLADNVLQGRWVLAVAGTHGKTTTSAILAWMLEYAGFKPGFLIGGVPHNFGVSARLGDSAFFVIEADEYDTAFFDKRSKFVHYRPRTAILNNLEFDHADIFPDLAAIETQFHHLVRTVPSDGAVVVNTSSSQAALQRVIERGCWSSLISFKGDIQSQTPSHPTPHQSGWTIGQLFSEGCYEVWFDGQLQGTVDSQLSGAHNRSNVLAALAAARHMGIAPAVAISAMAQFESVKRRMELRGTVNGIRVIDDFAHHPTAIATTLAGLRGQVGHGRILAVLEPRSNTMKLGVMKQALPASLADADLVFGYGETVGKNALGWDLGAVLEPLGNKAATYNTLDRLLAAITQASQPGDTIVCMSNGGFSGVHDKLLAAL
jgi:UDP-N-acetylmuramate: L-alanyl-gamma-D-glutamyl-meso-diaminopimelate ligase